MSANRYDCWLVRDPVVVGIDREIFASLQAASRLRRLQHRPARGSVGCQVARHRHQYVSCLFRRLSRQIRVQPKSSLQHLVGVEFPVLA